MKTHTATAHTNIALIKYWGKSADLGNLPATGSFSLTLDRFYTETSVSFVHSRQDTFVLEDHDSNLITEKKVIEHIEIFRRLSGRSEKLAIRSRNHVPTASGLASSASSFAALTLALDQAFNLKLDTQSLSIIARQGSGSAARSLFGGFVRMHGGPQITHEQSYAEPISSPLQTRVRMIVLECATKPKDVSSRDAMRATSTSSIFYSAFVNNHQKLIDQALVAAKEGDLEALGVAMERSTLQMHATMLGCDEPFWYFNQTTLLAIEEVKRLRKAGTLCFFTMDAGPHVKVLCYSDDAERIGKSFEGIAGISKITICASGPSAFVHE